MYTRVQQTSRQFTLATDDAIVPNVGATDPHIFTWKCDFHINVYRVWVGFDNELFWATRISTWLLYIFQFWAPINYLVWSCFIYILWVTMNNMDAWWRDVPIWTFFPITEFCIFVLLPTHEPFPMITFSSRIQPL